MDEQLPKESWEVKDFGKYKESVKAKKWEWIIQLGVSFIILLVFLLYYKQSVEQNKNFWTHIIEPFITAITFLLASAFGIIGIYKSWENSLSKRVTYAFVFSFNKTYIENLKKGEFEGKFPNEEYFKTLNDKIDEKDNFLVLYKKYFKKLGLKEWPDENDLYLIMVCYEAVLLHEDDLRNWAQQIGAQIATGGEHTNLSFFPFFKILSPQIRSLKIKNEKIFFKHYFYTSYLQKIPGKDADRFLIYDTEDPIENGWEDNYDDIPSNVKFRFRIRKIRDHEILDDYDRFKKYVNEDLKVKQTPDS